MENEPNILEQAVNTTSAFVDDHITGTLKGVTNTAADKLSPILSKEQTKGLIPLVGGAAVGLTGMLLLKPINFLVNGAFSLVANVATGFGLLPKIPLIGGLFGAIGDGIRKVGEYAGYVVPAIAAFIGYKALESKTPAIQNTTENSTAGKEGTAVGAAGTALLAARGKPPEKPKINLDEPKPGSKPATPATLAAFKEALGGEDNFRKFHEKALGRPPGDEVDPRLTESRVKALTKEAVEIRAQEQRAQSAETKARIDTRAKLIESGTRPGIVRTILTRGKARTAAKEAAKAAATNQILAETQAETKVVDKLAARTESPPAIEPPAATQNSSRASGTTGARAGNAAGAAGSAFGIYYGGSNFADGWETGDKTGMAIAATDAGVNTANTANLLRRVVKPSMEFGPLKALSLKLGLPLMLADGAYQITREDTAEHAVQRGAGFAVTTGTALGAGALTSAALPSAAGLTGATAIGVAALPLTVAVGSAMAVGYGADNAIETTRTWENTDALVAEMNKVDEKNISHLRRMAQKEYYLSSSPLLAPMLEKATRDTEGNIELTNIKNFPILRSALTKGKEAETLQMRFTNSDLPRWIRFGDSGRKELMVHEEAKSRIGEYDAALAELGLLEKKYEKEIGADKEERLKDRETRREAFKTRREEEHRVMMERIRDEAIMRRIVKSESKDASLVASTSNDQYGELTPTTTPSAPGSNNKENKSPRQGG